MSLYSFGGDFSISRFSDHGPSHPVIARLVVQTDENVPFANLSNGKKEEILKIAIHKLSPRLIRCFEIKDELFDLGEKAISEAEEDNNSQPDRGRLIRKPHLINLKPKVETFLYESKNFLRDLIELIDAFYETNCKEASSFYDPRSNNDGPLVKFFSEKFGAKDDFVERLREDQKWIKVLSSKRNAQEHPGGYSGTLTLLNFDITSDGEIVWPRWFLDYKTPSLIIEDLSIYCENLLTFAEEMISNLALKKSGLDKTMIIKEVPERDRDPSCPIRLRFHLKETLMKINFSP